MVPDEVSIYNLALNAIGARANISAPSENSREAEVCRLWYPVIRDQVLSAAHWTSCKSFKRLALLSEFEETWDDTDPEPGYTYAFGLPSDLLYPRYLTDFSRFSLSRQASSGRRLSTNSSTPILVYTSRNTGIASWESSLQMAVVYGLAANIVMPLSGKAQRANLMIQRANDLIANARELSANESEDPVQSLPDWIVARGYANPGSTRYIHPYGTMLSAPQG